MKKMSENGMNNGSQQFLNQRPNMPGLKGYPQQAFNGINTPSQHSSRGSSPSPYTHGNIPPSQLPPSRVNIPSTQLPPTNSAAAMNSVIQKTSRLSVHNQVIKPQFTSTPTNYNNEPVQKIEPALSANHAFSPITHEGVAKMPQNAVQDLQEIPLNDAGHNAVNYNYQIGNSNILPSQNIHGNNAFQMKNSEEPQTMVPQNQHNMMKPHGFMHNQFRPQNQKYSAQIPTTFNNYQPPVRTNFNLNPVVKQQNNVGPLINPPVLQNSPKSHIDPVTYNSRPPNFPMNRYPTPNFPQSAIPSVQYNHNINAPYAQNQMNVVNQGFSRLWGNDNVDLLQTVNILPTERILPPPITLGSDTLNLANCSSEIFRSTITKIPESQSLLQKSRLPLGILIHPFKDLTQLSVIQCNVIVRCRACRTYINPFVFFVDSKRWKCNLCYRVNELPEEFQYDPVSKTYGDPCRRPEIKSSTIEYIAPAEYMLRPPQPAIYLFLLDVSRLAVECGYLNVFCNILLEELDNLPGDARMQIGFLAYDSCLRFYSFGEGLSQPHEMIVLDIDDVFLPCPDNLLVNLKDRRELIEDLLKQLPERYKDNYDNNSALGAALQAAHRLMSATGGRVTVFQACLPNVGPGALTSREDPNQRTSSDVHNLKPANDFYKRLALECSSQQIAVDLFIVNSQYVDIATISGISRFSGGCINHFPLFKLNRTVLKLNLENCFRRYLTRKIGFEAVMRIRCTRGMSIHTFHGNFFVRSTDLLSLPNVNPDSGFGMQVSIEENLSDVETVCFQAALLYTSSKGERRIRVHTLCLPVVSNLTEVINSADQQCIIGLLTKMAVDRSIESSLSDAREAFINVAIDILSSYKMSLNLGSTPNGLLAPHCLKLLPLYISASLKNSAFRIGASTRLDDRVKAMIDMKTKPLSLLIQCIYPDLYPVHNLDKCKMIMNANEEQICLPPLLQLTSRLIDNDGVYLMDTGDLIYLYFCSNVSLKFLNDALGVANFTSLSEQIHEIPVLDNPMNRNLISFINYLNDEKPYKATIQIIKDNSPNRVMFLERLIEDRVENALSYHEFLQHIKSQVK